MEMCDNTQRTHRAAGQTAWLFLDLIKVRLNPAIENQSQYTGFWVGYKIHMELYYETTWSQALRAHPPPSHYWVIRSLILLCCEVSRGNPGSHPSHSWQTARGEIAGTSQAKNQPRADLTSAVNVIDPSSVEWQINTSSQNESACVLPSDFTLLSTLFSPPEETQELKTNSKNQRFYI